MLTVLCWPALCNGYPILYTSKKLCVVYNLSHISKNISDFSNFLMAQTWGQVFSGHPVWIVNSAMPRMLDLLFRFWDGFISLNTYKKLRRQLFMFYWFLCSDRTEFEDISVIWHSTGAAFVRLTACNVWSSRFLERWYEWRDVSYAQSIGKIEPHSCKIREPKAPSLIAE